MEDKAELYNNNQIVVFTLDNLLYALPLDFVIRVIHAIEVRSLSNTPDIISGIINVEGQIIPMVNIRYRFELPQKETEINDRIIIAHTGKRKVAMLVDSVNDIRVLSSTEFEDADRSLSFAEYIKGVAKTEEGLVLIYDLEEFLSLEEEEQLERALNTKK